MSMRTPMVRVDKKESLFFYLLLLTGFFLLLEISFFIQCNSAYFADFTFVSEHLKIPTSIGPGIIYFLVVQLFIHIAYAVFILLMSIFMQRIMPDASMIRLGIGLWFLGMVTIFVANQYFFPNSKFSTLTALVLFNARVLDAVFISCLVLCAIGMIVALIGFMQYISKKFVLMMTLGVMISFLLLQHPSVINPDAGTSQKPNIILVGVDSLRPDFLGFFGNDINTPFFDTFLNHATVFSEAVTPLARTFPSWVSILTGRYPKQTGVRFNLAPQHGLDLRQSLPAMLRRQGYATVFATDETRFSNIDTPFGFDRVVTPPMGLNDFLLGTLNDFPLSNLLVNTRLGRYLFPYSYANRPIYFTYEPNTFLDFVHPVLEEKRVKPLFLAIHFCLPHYPYLWARLAEDDLSVQARYQASIVRVDQQLRDFFFLLKQAHLLDHAIVVLLSDHGEALEFPGDRITEHDLFLTDGQKKISPPRFYPPSLDDEEVDQSAGHGTDVLGLPQYHSLLAFRLYGLKQIKRVVPGVVSLLDIAPTILQLTPGISREEMAWSGESLAAVIEGKQKRVPQKRHFFLESDFTPEAIQTVYPEMRQVMLEGIQIFQIDPVTTRLTVKKSMGEMIIRSKQYADIYEEWILALYPQNKTVRMPILINLETGEWTNDLNSSFAKQSPAKTMLQALHTFYGDELIERP